MAEDGMASGATVAPPRIAALLAVPPITVSDTVVQLLHQLRAPDAHGVPGDPVRLSMAGLRRALLRWPMSAVPARKLRSCVDAHPTLERSRKARSSAVMVGCVLPVRCQDRPAAWLSVG